MRKFIQWFISLFRKKSNLQVVSLPPQPVHEIKYNPRIIKITSGKRHVWVETRHGVVRKPIGYIK